MDSIIELKNKGKIDGVDIDASGGKVIYDIILC